MKINNILLLFSFLFIFKINAQDDVFKNYKPIESSGVIPNAFVEKSSDKVEDELDEFIQNDKGKTKKYKTDFLVSSTFGTKQVLLSGKVLFNDPVTKYINKVADEVFNANPDLDKNKFQVYAYKSPIVNAIAFNNGLVLINLGLIAQLENEAQLALILSHEFSHYVNEDGIDLFLESKDMDDGQGVYKNISYDDKMLYKSKYSQEIETTADMQGLEYYKNTKYSMKPVNGVFDVLKYSYLPFDDIAIDSNYFEHEFYKFPSEYKLSEINPISPDGLEEDDEDEEILRSHPDAEERREAILNNITIAEIKDESKKIFLASTEEDFNHIRNICRFEMPRMYLLHGYYEMAFYNAYLLEQKGFTDNIYLDKIKAKAIGQMSRKINNGDRPSRSKVEDIKELIQGEAQQLYFFLNSLGRSKKEFNVFAVQYTYGILAKYPDDEELEYMFEDLAYNMFEETNLKFSNFKKPKTKKVEPTLKDSIGMILATETQLQKDNDKSEKEKLMDEIRDEDSKYNKIEEKVKEESEIVEEKKVIKKEKAEKYYKYGFAKYMNDKKFVRRLKFIEKKYKNDDEDTYTASEQKARNKDYKLNRNRGYALGLEKITVVNPVYYSVSDVGSNPFKSEKGLENFVSILNKIEKKSKLDIDIVNTNDGKLLNTKDFNNATILDEWISEQFLFDEPLGFSSIEQEKINILKESFDTKYFLWTGVVSVDNKKRTFFFNVLFNLETNELELSSFKTMKYRTNKTLIKSEMYHVFDQIKTKRK